MKRMLVTMFLLTLLFLTVTSTKQIGITKANPYHDIGIPTPEGVNAPSIEINTPRNNTIISKNEIQLDVTSTVGKSNVSFDRDNFGVSYGADWLENETILYLSHYPDYENKSLVRSIVTLTNIPEGNHTLVVNAAVSGRITIPAIYPNIGLIQRFTISNSVLLTFIVDTTAPKITDLSLENKTYNSQNVNFTFSVNEPVIQTMYVLDKNGNITTTGQISLKNLAVGVHNITVFAQDEAGNFGASQTVYFTVEESFPAANVATIVLVAVVIVLSGFFLLYIWQRKSQVSSKTQNIPESPSNT